VRKGKNFGRRKTDGKFQKGITRKDTFIFSIAGSSNFQFKIWTARATAPLSRAGSDEAGLSKHSRSMDMAI
jgi:hypothetical protein